MGKLSHEGNVEQIFSLGGRLSDPNMNPAYLATLVFIDNAGLHIRFNVEQIFSSCRPLRTFGSGIFASSPRMVSSLRTRLSSKKPKSM